MATSTQHPLVSTVVIHQDGGGGVCVWKFLFCDIVAVFYSELFL